jgi:hypothetical protein
VVVDVIAKPSNSLRIIAFGDIDIVPGVDVNEQLSAALGRGLTDGDTPQVREVYARHSLVLHEAPQTRVILPDQAPNSSDRHVLDEGHDKRLEQKREAGSGSCPRHVDKAHATVRTVDASDARMWGKAWCWKKLRWRQVFLTVSPLGRPPCRNPGTESGHPEPLPSASNLASATIQGVTKRSRKTRE